MPPLPDEEARRRLAAARIARLATIRADGRPHVVPIVFAVEGDTTIRLLRQKYPQYATWTTPFGAATVIEVERLASWTI